MQAGKLFDRATFYRRPQVPESGAEADEYGNVEGDWLEVFSCPARIVAERGREQVQALRVQGVQPVQVTVLASRRTREVTTDWQLRDRAGQVYNIRAVTPGERRDEIQFLCEAGVAQG